MTEDARAGWRRVRQALEARGGRSSVGGGRRIRLWGLFDRLVRVFGLGLRLTGLYRRGVRNALDIRLTELEFHFPDLPTAFDGYRIAHLTDPHLDGLPGITEAALRVACRVEADLCVFTGDYRMRTSGPFEQVLPGLEALRDAIGAPDGALVTFGNHDCMAMVEPLEAMGMQVLVNQGIEIARNGESITLTGLDDVHWFYSDAAAAALRDAPGRFKIALVHSAEVADLAADAGYALYLAGHTHAGQICLPGGRVLFSHMVRLREYARGVWRRGAMQGYTSSGIGVSSLPVRFNTRGEIAVISLRRTPTG